jgi:hypothetical protein
VEEEEEEEEEEEQDEEEQDEEEQEEEEEQDEEEGKDEGEEAGRGGEEGEGSVNRKGGPDVPVTLALNSTLSSTSLLLGWTRDVFHRLSASSFLMAFLTSSTAAGVKFCPFAVALRMTSRWRLNRLLSFFNAVRRTSSAQHRRQQSEGSTPSKLHQCCLASTTNSAPNNNGIVSTSSSIPLTPRERRQGDAPRSMHRTGSAARSPFILSCLFMLCVRRAT